MVMIVEIYSWTWVFIATETEKLIRVSLRGETMCLHLHPRSRTPTPIFVFTLEIPSRVPPGSVWRTTSVFVPPHPGSPHPEPPSSHSIPPAKTPAANPSQQPMAKVFPLRAGFQVEKRTRGQTQSGGTDWKSPLCSALLDGGCFLECGNDGRSFLIRARRSHVPVLHKHTCLDTHLPASCYFS